MEHPTVCCVLLRSHLRLRNATPDERLLAAAKSDNKDMLMDVLEQPGSYDINHQDGFVYRPQPYLLHPHYFDI